MYLIFKIPREESDRVQPWSTQLCVCVRGWSERRRGSQRCTAKKVEESLHPERQVICWLPVAAVISHQELSDLK